MAPLAKPEPLMVTVNCPVGIGHGSSSTKPAADSIEAANRVVNALEAALHKLARPLESVNALRTR